MPRNVVALNCDNIKWRNILICRGLTRIDEYEKSGNKPGNQIFISLFKVDSGNRSKMYSYTLKAFDVHHWEGLRIDIMPNDWKLGMNMERSMIPLQCLYSIEETFVILTKMQYNLPILQVNQTWRVFSRPVVNTFILG